MTLGRQIAALLGALAVATLGTMQVRGQVGAGPEWPTYGGDLGNTRYFATANSNNNISPGAPRSVWVSVNFRY